MDEIKGHQQFWFGLQKNMKFPLPHTDSFWGWFCPVLAVDWLLVFGPRSFTVDFKFEVSEMYIFNFSEQRLHLLHTEAQQCLHWCYHSLGFGYSEALAHWLCREYIVFESPCWAPSAVLSCTSCTWVVVVLICWGTAVASVWGWMRMCWVSALTSTGLATCSQRYHSLCECLSQGPSASPPPAPGQVPCMQ